MFKYFLVFIISVAIMNTAYKGAGIKQLNAKDSCEILQVILNRNEFRNLAPRLNSLFIVKSEVVNNSWPTKTKYFNVFYIKGQKDVAIIDFSINTYYDKRLKITIPVFEMDNNIAVISLVVYYKREHFQYYYKIKFIKNKWTIIKYVKD